MNARDIKRAVFKMHGLDLPDEELDKAYLFTNDEGGVVVRFKACLNTKDWKMTVGSCK